MINGVGVLYKDRLFACMAVPDNETGLRFKCGQCQVGVVPPKIGEACSVCGAKVQYIDDGHLPPFTREAPDFGLKGYAVKQSKRFAVLQITQSHWKFLPDECTEMAATVLAEAAKHLPEFGEEVEISFEIRTPKRK